MDSVPSSLWEWMASIHGEGRFLLLVWCLVFITIVTAVICATIYGMHKNRMDDGLKREMLERGMSAEEIATVIRARPRRGLNPASRNS